MTEENRCKNIRYVDFINIFSVDNPQDWRGMTVRTDGVWVQPLLPGDPPPLFPGELEPLLKHTKNDSTTPALTFPCSYVEVERLIQYVIDQLGLWPDSKSGSGCLWTITGDELLIRLGVDVDIISQLVLDYGLPVFDQITREIVDIKTHKTFFGDSYFNKYLQEGPFDRFLFRPIDIKTFEKQHKNVIEELKKKDSSLFKHDDVYDFEGKNFVSLSKESKLGPQHHLSDSELSKWSGVGEVTLNEAAYLWCETRPPDKPTIKDFRNPETWWPHPPVVNRWIARLKGAIDKGELNVSRIVCPDIKIPYGEGRSLIPEKTYYLSIEDLKRFANSIGQEPKFLSSLIHRNGKEDLDSNAELAENQHKNVNFFTKEKGDYWHIGFDGKEARIKHCNGLLFINYLLKKPGESITCQELYQALSGKTPDKIMTESAARDQELHISGKQEISSKKAKNAYLEELKNLKIELSMAETQEEREILNNKIETINSHMKERKYFSDSNDKKAQVNIKKRLDIAYKAIDEAGMKKMAKHLRAHIIPDGAFGLSYTGDLAWNITIK